MADSADSSAMPADKPQHWIAAIMAYDTAVGRALEAFGTMREAGLLEACATDPQEDLWNRAARIETLIWWIEETLQAAFKKAEWQ